MFQCQGGEESRGDTEMKLRVKYVRSAIGYAQDQKDTIRSLGLRKLQHTVEVEDTPAMRGMINKVRHLVQVEEVA
jgi:large subunit ribosomal protein L30